MKRRALLIAGLFAFPLAALGQPTRRIGILTLSDLNDPAVNPVGPAMWRALEERLGEHGHVEGKNLAIERRHAAGRIAQVGRAAADLKEARVELVVTVGAQMVRATQRALPKMPIVTLLGDPVGGGFAKTLARPGGMVTGVTNIGADVSVKQLELLRETLPGLKRIGILGNSSNPFTRSLVGSLDAGAKRLGLSVEQFDAPSADGVDDALGAIGRHKPGAVVVVQDLLLVQQGKRIADALAAQRVASAGGGAEQAGMGLLMSYGANMTEAFRRMAGYVDRILRGAKPGELPFEILETYELVLNLRTAKALGISVPQSVRVRADRVIE